MHWKVSVVLCEQVITSVILNYFKVTDSFGNVVKATEPLLVISISESYHRSHNLMLTVLHVP